MNFQNLHSLARGSWDAMVLLITKGVFLESYEVVKSKKNRLKVSTL